MRLHFLAPALIAGMMAFTTSCSKDNDTPEKEITNDDYKNLTVREGEAKDIKYLNAATEGKWVYFSFEKGIVEETTATPTTSDWDVAFNRYHVRTNSGTSGNGNGGALKTELKDFAQLTTASATASYTVDSPIRVASYSGGGQGTNTTISASTVLEIGHGEGFWNMIKNGTLTAAAKRMNPNFDNLSEQEQNNILASLEQRIKPSIVHNNGWLTMDYSQGATGPSYTYNNWVYVIRTHNGKYAKIQLTDYKNAKNITGHITFKYELANTNNEFK